MTSDSEAGSRTLGRGRTEGRTMQDGDTGLGDRRRDLGLLKIDLTDPCNVLKSGAPVLMVWVDKEEDHSLGDGWSWVRWRSAVHPISMRLMRW